MMFRASAAIICNGAGSTRREKQWGVSHNGGKFSYLAVWPAVAASEIETNCDCAGIGIAVGSLWTS